MSEESEQPPRKPSLWQAVKSALWAGFGVQSDKNRERDFRHGNIKTFIVIGIVLTVLFVATVITLVQVITRHAS